MKILQITFNLCPGGAERFVVDLSNELVNKHEVVLMTLMDDSVTPETDLFYRDELDRRVVYKNLGLKKGNGFSFSVLFKVYKAMRDEHADIIHFHVNGVINFCILGIVLLCEKTVLVQTIHTDFKIGHSSLLYKTLFRTIGRWHKMRWVALSESNYEDILSEYPYLLCRRIDNARAPLSPTPQFNQVSKEISGFKHSDNTVVFLHVARCIAVKNQRMLISAFNRIAALGYDVVLLIIGPGFDNVEGFQLKEDAGQSIHFLGTRKNISDYMLQADAFCLSSLYEGLPITILEALLSGTPVVSTPVKGALDVLDDGETGVISKDFSENEYVFALERAIKILDQLSANVNREKENSPYSIKECAIKYEEFYSVS